MKVNKFLLALLPLLLAGCSTGTSSTTASDSTSASNSNSTVAPITESSPSNTSTSSSPIKVERSVEEMIADLEHPMTVTGSVKEILVSKDSKETTLSNEETLILGDKSYHIEVEGESYPDGAYTSSVYRSEDGKDTCVHYYISNLNTVESEDITDDDGKALPWSDYANPWKDIHADAFTRKDDALVGELDLSIYASDFNLIMARYTNTNFVAMASAHSDLTTLWKSFSLKIQSEKIVGLTAESVNITDTLGTERLSYDFNFDYSDTTEHEYAKPTPLPSDEAHDKLRTALKEFLTADFSYHGTSESYGEVATINGIVTSTGMYFYDSLNSPMLSGQVGFVMKDIDSKSTLVHVIEDANGKYFYQVDSYGTPYDPRTLKDLTTLANARPQIVIAPEFFSYDESANSFTITGKNAGVFGKYFAMESQIDPATIQMADHLVITLDDQGHLFSTHAYSFSNDIDIYTRYSFSNVKLPFDPASLTEYNPLSEFVGTYTGTIAATDTQAEQTYTIVVTLEGVTFNGTAATDVSVTNGRLYFTASDGTAYNIRTSSAGGYNLYKGYTKVCALAKA